MIGGTSCVAGFCKPQLATAVDRAPSGENWIHEIKYDGYRFQATKVGERIHLFTRSGHDWTAKFPHIEEAVRRLNRDWLHLDGELVVFDETANTACKALQAALKSTPAASSLSSAHRRAQA